MNLKRRYSARLCATRTKHKYETNQLCSIKQRALNTTNTFQSYCLYSSYSSVIILIIVIAGDDELMLLYHHCCNSLLNPGVESTLPAHTHTCFLTNSASSVRFLIHSSLYGVKQTNFRFLCLCWCCSFSPCISAQLMLAAASCDCEDLVLLVTCQANWHFLFLLSFYSSTFFHFFHTKLSSPKCASTQPR